MNHSIPQEQSVTELDKRLFSQYEKARDRLQSGDQGYALKLAQEWNKRYPHVHEFRKLLRDSQLKQLTKSEMSPKLGGLIGSIGVKSKDPLQTLNNCEKRLSRDPLNIAINELLAQTAEDLGWIKTSFFAWETVLKNPNRKATHVVSLAESMLKIGESESVVKLCEYFLKIFPNDPSILQIRNKASVSRSMDRVRG